MAELDERYLNVNRFDVLRVPGPLWLAMAFLGRHWILLIITLASRRSPDAIQLASSSLSAAVLLLELPVLILAYAGFARYPTAGKVLRGIWHNGRAILAATAVINLGLLAWFLWHADVWRRPELFLASCGLLDLAIVYGIYSSAYIKQVFMEFPAPAGPGGTPS
ncbi:DUF2919 family protein [Polaromonas sp.]|uniref:DUF2919 family protein n=1 Tax=Polaromonas sp. TaxID=1869339 RepID=UPI003752A41E